MRGRFLLLLLLGLWTNSRIFVVTELHMIKSEFFGDFLLADSTVVADSHTNMTLPATSLCQCIRWCWSASFCFSASFQTLGDGGECRLSREGPADTEVNRQNDTVYIYWTKSVKGRHWIGEDGLLYLALDDRTKANQAAAACHRYPGHYLGVYTTRESFAILKDFYDIDGQDVAVGLNMVNNIPTWDDGTSFFDTASVSPYGLTIDGAETYFTLSKGSFEDRGGTWSARVLCQAVIANL